MISMYIVQFWPLIHLPLSDLRSDQYSLSRYRKPANFSQNMALCHSNSTTIGQIANPTVGDERAAKTPQSTCWSCHDTIRTQIHHWRQSCRNGNTKPESGFNLAKEQWVYVWSGEQPSAIYPGWVALQFLTRTRALGLVPTWTNAG